jgi:HNH endonuclease
VRKGSGRPLAVRFWERVLIQPRQCWLWQGVKSATGYGNFKLHRRCRVSAHRVAWELVYGPIPAGYWVLHRCDVKRCVNPEHLWLGDATDNARDRSQKGRNRDQTGERNNGARLRAGEISAIRRQYALGGVTQRQLAINYGISQSHISRVVNGLEWGAA